MNFNIQKIMCSEGCRNGLTVRNENCSHLKDLEKLAAELVDFECNQKVQSDLFIQLELYVDDPQFWAACLNFNEKLQRHKPVWIQKAFLATARKQLTHLSYRPLKKTTQKLFQLRSKQLLMIDENAHDFIRYLLQKQTQFF